MSIQGSLQETALPVLIQTTCQQARTARLVLDHQGDEGEVYIQDGQVVHAEHGARSGKQAVFEMIAWQDGSYSVENDVLPPVKTITLTWTELLLESVKQLGQERVSGSKERTGDTSQILASLKGISGVLGVVETAQDGTVLGADLPDSDGESEAAVAVFLGGAADQIGELMALGPFERGVGTIGPRRMLVMKRGEGYVGLVLNEQASPALVGSAASNILRS